MQRSDTKPWWKYAWPWILMGGPALAIVGCAITIWMAFTVSPDTQLHDGVVQHGLKVTEQKAAH